MHKMLAKREDMKMHSHSDSLGSLKPRWGCPPLELGTRRAQGSSELDGRPLADFYGASIRMGLIIILFLVLAGCSKDSRKESANSTLRGHGFSDIRLAGTPWLSCGKKDSLWISYMFEAKNPHGKQVSGMVCCGAMRGCIVKFP